MKLDEKALYLFAPKLSENYFRSIFRQPGETLLECFLITFGVVFDELGKGPV